MSADAENTSEFADRLSDAIRESRDFARAAYGYDFDQARRNIPLDASGLEIDRLKDPYALDFLGLEPLPGDPTIEDMERTSAVDYLPEPEEIEQAVNEVIQYSATPACRSTSVWTSSTWLGGSSSSAVGAASEHPDDRGLELGQELVERQAAPAAFGPARSRCSVTNRCAAVTSVTW